MAEFNLYCDESGHLERDQVPVMVLGAVMCPTRSAGRIARDLRRIKRRHGLGHDKPASFEVKWSKVSRSGVEFYRDYLDYFFDCNELSFRALVVRGKSQLRHSDFDQTHDDWYYKMYYQKLEPLIGMGNTYELYLDIKDTLSQHKVEHLRQVLSYNLHDFDGHVLPRVQHVRSDEVEQVQLVDTADFAETSSSRPHVSGTNECRSIQRLSTKGRRRASGTSSQRRKKFRSPMGQL